jgi:hypothetical protein
MTGPHPSMRRGPQTPSVLQDANPDTIEGLQGKTPAVQARA